MDTLSLVKPDQTYLEQIADFRREFLAAGSSMDGCGPLHRMEDPMEWLLEREAASRLETLPPGRVLSTQMLCVRETDGRLVGMIQLRPILNDYLKKYAGHIGYSVPSAGPPAWRKSWWPAWTPTRPAGASSAPGAGSTTARSTSRRRT